MATRDLAELTMRNDEARNTQARMTKPELRPNEYISGFGLRHSFVLRHSSFVIAASF
jgi:hypothetical protein